MKCQPPELRLAAIGTAGIALFVFGFRLFSRQPGRLAYALTLQGAGVAVLYLTVFAAFRLYQFLPAGAAFGVLALVCAFSTAIALLQNAMPMAFIGFAGAFAAPILLSTGQGDHVGLFSYYLLLKPAIVSVIVFQFIWTMNDFMGPLIYLASVEKYPVSLALKMSIGATEEVEWANVIAISVVALIPSVAVFFAAQKHFIEGATSSGVKG